MLLPRMYFPVRIPLFPVRILVSARTTEFRTENFQKIKVMFECKKHWPWAYREQPVEAYQFLELPNSCDPEFLRPTGILVAEFCYLNKKNV